MPPVSARWRRISPTKKGLPPVSARRTVGELHALVVDAVPGGDREQGNDFRIRQSGERDPLDALLAIERGERPGQRTLRADIGVAVGRDDQDRRHAELADEVPEELQAAAVGPVQVVEHDHDRPRRRQRGEQGRDRGEQHVLIALVRAGRSRDSGAPAKGGNDRAISDNETSSRHARSSAVAWVA